MCEFNYKKKKPLSHSILFGLVSDAGLVPDFTIPK